MKITYDDKEDLLFIRFNDKPIIRDISYGWNMVAGITEDGLGQITILDADKDGVLPVEAPEALLRHVG